MQVLVKSWPNKEEASLVCLANREREMQTETRQTREGNKIPELLQEKRKLDLSFQFECKPPQYLNIKHLDMH